MATREYTSERITRSCIVDEILYPLVEASARRVQLGGHILAEEPTQEVVRRQAGHPNTSVRSRTANVGQHNASAAPSPRQSRTHLSLPIASPWSGNERVIRPHLGLALDDVDPGTIQPPLMEGLRERVRVDEGAPGGVHEHSALLHRPQERLVHDVVRRGSTRGEHEHDVALARELLERHAAQLAHTVLGGERGVRRGVRRRLRVRGVETVLEAEGDEAGERRLRDAPEADEACSAFGRGRGCAQLGPAECERGPDEVGPLGYKLSDEVRTSRSVWCIGAQS